MRLGEKLRYLREVEGALRGFNRALTQQEVVRLLKKEQGKAISQSYLSQIESGARPHLTNPTRMLLARFFKVQLISGLGASENTLDLLLREGAERFHDDPDLRDALLKVARHEDSRRCVVLLGEILDNPGLAERLLQVLGPAAGGRHSR
jgi:transcriptional regulator with XRE-family HTH domain